MSNQQIKLKGVRVNNLKGIDLAIPHGQLVSICGVSGSGKSSLAFDTLYAEGQRRYFESLSPYSRRFLEQLPKPDADSIEALPPAIAVRADRSSVHGGQNRQMMTVGMATEVASLLQIAFSQLADLICPQCNEIVNSDNSESVSYFVNTLEVGTKFLVVFDAKLKVDESSNPEVQYWLLKGFSRCLVGGSTHSLESISDSLPYESMRIVVDRLTVGQNLQRLLDSCETAFQFGSGAMSILWESNSSPTEYPSVALDGKNFSVRNFSTSQTCGSCGREFPLADPRLFDFTNPLGGCGVCHGTGIQANASVKIQTEDCDHCEGTRYQSDALAYRLNGKNISQLCDLEIASLMRHLIPVGSSTLRKVVAQKLLPGIESRLTYLCQVGLEYLSLGREISTLSSGELQRVMLTKILGSTLTDMMFVLDEPSSGMHESEKRSLSEKIRQIAARGNTVILVDHSEAVFMQSDRLIEIGPAAGVEGGELVYDGPCDQVIDNEQSITGHYIARRSGLLPESVNRRLKRGTLYLSGANGNNLKN
ncbi:MAG: hypothetical protein AAGA30_15170, partial [Planctomycetota bacterium]